MTGQIHPIPAYFVVVQDYGPRGREGIVDPGLTRADVVAHIASGEWKDVIFIQYVAPDQVPEDMTEEIIAEAMDLRSAA